MPPAPPAPCCCCTNWLWNFLWFQLKLYREGQSTGRTGRPCDAAKSDKKTEIIEETESSLEKRKKEVISSFQQTSNRANSICIVQDFKKDIKLWARNGILPLPDHHSDLISVAHQERNKKKTISVDLTFSFLMVLCSELRSPSNYFSSSSPETVSLP